MTIEELKEKTLRKVMTVAARYAIDRQPKDAAELASIVENSLDQAYKIKE